MRFRDVSFDSFNLVGSVCSIIALLLTASSKLGIANLTQITFGVLAGISVGGLVMNWILSLYREWFDLYSYFFTKCIFWLFFGVIVALVALLFGRLGYWIMDMIVNWAVLPLLMV